MIQLDSSILNWHKMGGLIPAIIQHAENGKVLMLGYMNEEALIATVTTGQLTLYSRSRKRLWRKGETSGNTMTVCDMSPDCDQDSILVTVIPKGTTCHLGDPSCFQSACTSTLAFVDDLMNIIADRARLSPETSYTAQLLNSGNKRCAQKVGEEAVETVLAAMDNDSEELINEAADLFYHLLVLLKGNNLNFYHVITRLHARNNN
ncbi:MAG: bifunctional phosphoribosyl-AMP cyclohydrolase/phosphoribosyl-ATP diphosphatase [Legionella sp. 40-6]|nr:bifunctional phosphoribosyl-AMP cyclohydrolase/phosphoribosyl-ATP diphosphatase HisIE [Legionella sp.]OJY46423.1 MAG: bifunctional phosphoribosyl-AMP cyclohydrolase/phosphoribosyl-ATP diphosphatase [Legionella sp. 40-6]